MIELPLNGTDSVALIDGEHARLASYRWGLDREGYVCRRSHGKRIYLHKVLLPEPYWPASVRDHFNRNKLDNRMSNLRWVNHKENAANSSRPSTYVKSGKPRKKHKERDKPNRIRLNDGRLLALLNEGGGSALSVLFCPEGKRIGGGDLDLIGRGPA